VSVPAAEFGQIYGQPPVMGEVVELDLAEKGSRDGSGSESPCVGITAEFEAGQKKPDTDAGLGAGDQRELREHIGGRSSRHCDPDQTALGLGRLDLSLHAGNRDLRGGRLPLVLGAEPRDRLFVGWDVGGAGADVSRVDDLFELQARGVVVDVLRWIGARSEFVGAGDGDQLDVDLHLGLSVGADGERRRGSGKNPRERSAAARWRAPPADGNFCAQSICPGNGGDLGRITKAMRINHESTQYPLFDAL